MNRELACALGLVLSVASFFAAAAGDVDTSAINVEPMMTQLDRNKDGFVDRKEAKEIKSLSSAFDEQDKNKDGKLDRAELAQLLARIGAPPLPGAQ